MVCDGCSIRFFPVKIFCVSSIESFPDRRITAMSLMPWAVASATIVSLGEFNGLFFKFNLFNSLTPSSFLGHPSPQGEGAGVRGILFTSQLALEYLLCGVRCQRLFRKPSLSPSCARAHPSPACLLDSR